MIRFSVARNDKLPFHRFSVGDSVRVTLNRSVQPCICCQICLISLHFISLCFIILYPISPQSTSLHCNTTLSYLSQLAPSLTHSIILYTVYRRGGDPLDEEAINGVVLDRRLKYLDVCLRTADAMLINQKVISWYCMK